MIVPNKLFYFALYRTLFVNSSVCSALLVHIKEPKGGISFIKDIFSWIIPITQAITNLHS